MKRSICYNLESFLRTLSINCSGIKILNQPSILCVICTLQFIIMSNVWSQNQLPKFQEFNVVTIGNEIEETASNFNSSYEASIGSFPDQVCPAWTIADNASPENPTLSNSKLILSTSNHNENMLYYQSDPNISFPDPFIFEARVKLISGASNSNARAPIVLGVQLGNHRFNSFQIGSDEIFLLSSHTVRGPSVSLDTDDSFHTYRMEISGQDIAVYYDGNLSLLGSVLYDAVVTNQQLVFWGDGSGNAYGTSEWEYVKHNASTMGSIDDNDNDGFSVCQGDCDDFDPNINPGMTEIVDNGKDDDCNRFTFDGISEDTNAHYVASGGVFPNQVCPAWTIFDDATPEEPIFSDGKLLISTSDYEERMIYYHSDSDISFPDPFIFEARVKLISGASNSNARAPIVLGVQLGNHRFNSFQIGSDEIFLLSSHTVRGPSVSLDTDDSFHTYRMEISGQDIAVYYDGNLALTGSVLYDEEVISNQKIIQWGDGTILASGTSEWEYVKHNAIAYNCKIDVAIDIKPGSDPNSINCNNDKGVIPVAILTTDDFDATTVDHTTVIFEGAIETHVNKKTGEPKRHEEDVDGDGDTDLVFHFRFGDTDLTCDSEKGTLVGATFDDQVIEGADAVNIIGASKFTDSSDKAKTQSFISDVYALEQNYPNPFNPTTEITFALPEATEVHLVIYNSSGQLVRTIASGQFAKGRHSMIWDATDDNSVRVASGVYFYMLKTDAYVAQRKLVLTK